jgi:hypothetical protein
VSIPALAQLSRVKLEEGQTYNIKVDGFEFEMQVPAADLL